MVQFLQKCIMAEYYDKVTKIITVPFEDVPIHKDGLGCLLFESMKKTPYRIAQIDAATGKEDPFSLYLDRCIRTALKMQEMGLKPGDMISICSHNHLDSSVPLIASLFMGILSASLDPTISQEDTTNLIGIVKPNMIFVAPGSEQMIQTCIRDLGLESKIVVFGDSEEFMEFREFSMFEADVEKFRPRVVPSVEDDAVILFSSGTTGLPKGIRLNHKGFMQACTTDIPGTLFGYATLYWLSSHLVTYVSIIFGRTRVVNLKFDLNTAWDNIHRLKINILFLAPCDAIQLCHRLPEYDLSHVKFLVIGGGAIPWEFIVKLRKKLSKALVAVVYGQTELINIFSFEEPNVYNKPNCVGSIMHSRTYKIVDPETEENLGPNQEGELRVKSDSCMNGYYNIDSSNAWDSDGFLKTGDVAYFDDDFCFFIVDRIKEMFKYKGWHIVPAQLEAILCQHPDVDLAVVVGVPHIEDDNHATAVVILQNGAEGNADEIRKFVDEQVDHRHKLRGGVKFVESFPQTPSAKIKRRDVVKMIVNGEI